VPDVRRDAAKQQVVKLLCEIYAIFLAFFFESHELKAEVKNYE
jgi:hypothetical protein